MMGYKMSEQAASLRMPLYVYAFKQNSRTIVDIMSGSGLDDRYCAVTQGDTRILECR